MKKYNLLVGQSRGPTAAINAVYMKNSKFDGGVGNKSACRFEEAVCDAII